MPATEEQFIVDDEPSATTNPLLLAGCHIHVVDVNMRAFHWAAISKYLVRLVAG